MIRSLPDLLKRRWSWVPAKSPMAFSPPRRVLLLAGEEGRVLSDKSEIVWVRPGASFVEETSRHFVVDPREPGHWEKLIEILREQDALPDGLVHLWTFARPSGDRDLFDCWEETSLGVTQVLIRQLIKARGKAGLRWLYVLPVTGNHSPVFSAAHVDLARAVFREKPKVFGKVVVIDDQKSSDLTQFWPALLSELAAVEKQGVEIKLGEKGRDVRQLTDWAPAEHDLPPISCSSDGVYLIQGEVDKWSVALAEYLIARGSRALALLSDAKPSEELETQFTSWRARGVQAECLRVNRSSGTDFSGVVNGLRERHGGIRGVIYSTCEPSDATCFPPEPTVPDSVGKVLGLHHLDEATQKDELEFFAGFYFSAARSTSERADTVTGSRFLESFVTWRNQLLASGDRTGPAMSVHCQWQEANCIPDETVERLIGWMVEAAKSKIEHIVAMATDQSGIEQMTTPPALTVEPSMGRVVAPALTVSADASTSASVSAPAFNGTEMRRRVENFLRGLIAGECGLPVEQIEVGEALERYQVDSVKIMNLNRKLGKEFSALPQTLFYEHQTIAALAGYFLEKQSTVLTAKFPAQPSEFKDSTRIKTTDLGAAKTETIPSVLAAVKTFPEDAVAVIGLSGRYPQAGNLDEFWKALSEGMDCITEIPTDRWDYRSNYDPTRGKPGRTYGKWGGFVADADKFDPLFFSISPREAELMDPQERLFLQAAWHAVEDAGYRKSEIEREPVGVFVGVMWSHYQLVGMNESLAGLGEAPTAIHGSIANRVSYTLNLRGPSMAIDTMCSSSLTAVHLACESLRRGECTVALAGGVNLCVHPLKFNLLAQNGMLSSDGRCRSFGAGGDGYVPGEGVGVLLLKPLNRALANGDHIYGVIKGSVVNHGGKTNGYTVPNPVAQGELIRAALSRSGVEPSSISYVEAHGTGTPLGDPIEINGLERAFSGAWSTPASCAVGSLKSNIGHLEAAAGVAGITKVLLQFERGQLAPSLHASLLNPNIDFARSAFRVVRELEPWTPASRLGTDLPWPRRAGVSSFGAGGANAHIILEEPPAAVRSAVDETPQLIVLSAKTPDRLKAVAGRLADWLGSSTARAQNSALVDVAWTLQIGREPMEVRVAFVAASLGEVAEKARAVARGETTISEIRRSPSDEAGRLLRQVLGGEVGTAFLAQLVAQRDWSKLAEVWTAGVEINWLSLHPAPRRRVPLPGYAFAAQRYWVPTVSTALTPAIPSISSRAPATEPAANEAVPSEAESSDEVLENLFLVRDWKPVARVEDLEVEVAPGLLLVNADCPPAILESARGRWLVVRSGPQVEVTSDGISTFDFDDAAQGRIFFEQLLAVRPQLGSIVDLADVWSEPREEWTIDQGRVALLQVWLAAPTRGPLHLLHLTAGLQTFGHNRPTLAGATHAGLVKMMSAEYTQVRAQTADLDGVPAGLKEIEILFEAMRMGDPAETEVCYRRSVRHVPIHRRIVPPTTAPEITIRKDRGYLIVGGTSGIGLELATHLVAKGARRLALMGVNPLPPRAEWPELIARGDARTRRRLETFLAFEQQGIEVETHFGPLDASERIAEFLTAASTRFGGLAGVVHSATAPFNSPDPYFINKSPGEIARVLTPKLIGTRQLKHLIETQALDFFIVFSSVASALPSRGQGVSHYAMANAFLDRFAEYQHARGFTQVKSINWVYWGESGGMAGEKAARQLARYGIFPQTNDEGLNSFDRLVGLSGPRAIAGRLSQRLRDEARLVDDGWIEQPNGGVPWTKTLLHHLVPERATLLAQLDEEKTSQLELSDYVALALLKTLQERRVFVSGDQRHRIAGLAEQLGVRTIQQRLWQALIGLLARKDFVVFTDSQTVVTRPKVQEPGLLIALDQLPRRAAEFSRKYPTFSCYIQLIDTALAGLWAVLRGERSATDVLFPKGSLALVEAVYRGNPISDAFNALVADSAVALTREANRRGTAGYRILEIGAGTGGTSASVLAALSKAGVSVEYHYTDVSAGFTGHGKQRFGEAYPFTQFHVLDITRSISKQGFAVGEFDVVIAANVLHATRDIEATLRETKRLLRPGGVLLLNELTELHDFATVTFGLLDGWWQFADPARRIPDAPLLDQSGWRAVLESANFVSVFPSSLPSFQRAGDQHQTLFAAVAGARFPDQAAKGASPLEQPTERSAMVLEKRADAPLLTSAVLPMNGPAGGSNDRLVLVKEVFGAVLKIAPSEFTDQAEFAAYGVDSILMGNLVRALEARLGLSLNPALLIENSSFARLAAALEQIAPALIAPPSTPFASITAIGGTPADKTPLVSAPRESERRADLAQPSPPILPVGRAVPVQAKQSSLEQPDQRIAVIGLACEFPQAPNLEAFWLNLKEGRCGVREVPLERWSTDELYAPESAAGKCISKWGGFIRDIDQFDPGYFEISDRDAPFINPLIRKFLESSVQAMRHAGYEKTELQRTRTGVFVGSRINEYGLELSGRSKNRILGVGQNFIAAHLSQFLNLSGPAFVVDSACSSSLTSLHLACQSLRIGECEMAFAGGVDLLLDERPYLILSEMGALSPEGRCRTFDEKANGFVPGEGCGVTLLKPLSAALRDGDRIYAVIEGSAVNNDGNTMGVTTPNPDAQSRVIETALALADVAPEHVGYVETHGTGTVIGDPIELKALTRVLARATKEKQFCGVGSVKSNIGHLLSAAGIASFIKVVLGLVHEKIPPTLFCETPNPRFAFADSPLYPATRLTPWRPRGGTRRAGISSFGLGGTNAHLLIRQAAMATAPVGRRPLPPIEFKRRRFWIERLKAEGSSRWLLPPLEFPLASRAAAPESDAGLELVEEIGAL